MTEKRTPPTAVCRVDGEPLMMTFRTPKYEFVCMVCGKKYTYFGPGSAVSTPELDARYEVLVKLFDAGIEPGDPSVPVEGRA